jgi:hypothetical protein
MTYHRQQHHGETEMGTMEDADLVKLIDDRVRHLLAERAYTPTLWPSLPPDAPFMEYGTVSSADFRHPRYFELCRLLHVEPTWHRKQWEWIFIAHHIVPRVKPGMRGLVFGVGTEPMPAMFANLGASIVATDAPDDQGLWSIGSQWSAGLDAIRKPYMIPNERFDQLVSFRPCDMTNIDADLRGFDFCWSSCAFEHLGSIEAGLKFVRDSLDTLRPGGVAVHTTEFNLSSNTDTVDNTDTVLFRMSDLQRLSAELRAQGHDVTPIIVSPSLDAMDHHVDTPPFSSDLHLKLKLAGYVTTSVGIVVRKAKPSLLRRAAGKIRRTLQRQP